MQNSSSDGVLTAAGCMQAITPQLPGLAAAGFDVRCLYMPLANRAAWPELTTQATGLLRDLIAASPHDRVGNLGVSLKRLLSLRIHRLSTAAQRGCSAVRVSTPKLCKPRHVDLLLTGNAGWRVVWWVPGAAVAAAAPEPCRASMQQIVCSCEDV